MKSVFTLVQALCFLLLFVLSSALHSQVTTTGESQIKTKISSNLLSIGLSNDYLQSSRISAFYKDAATGIEHIYLQQRYQGIDVYNQMISLAFKDDKLLYSSGAFITSIEKKATQTTPAITPQAALLQAAAHLHLPLQAKRLEIRFDSFSTAHKVAFAANGIAKRDIETKLYWVADSLRQVHLVWNVNIDVAGESDWWNIRVDATSGEVIQKDNWTIYERRNDEFANTPKTTNEIDNTFEKSSADEHFFAPPTAITSATYNVIPFPAENKNVSNFSNVTNPWEKAGTGNNAVTYGWHYNGTTDYTITRGNNVYAYDDTAARNRPGTSAQSSTSAPNLKFVSVPDFLKQPSASVNLSTAITNLFYWNNLMHDVLYQYGFDEASGNFQASNISRGGAGNDYVLAEAQDGSGTDNANFSTPSDGQSGRMQMYIWPSPPILTISKPAALAKSYTSVEGGFSTNNQLYKKGPVTDTVVYYSRTDTLGCSASLTNNVRGKIALLYRGSCNFTVKVKDAQNAGAVGVIVVNNTSGDPIVMGGSDNSITIPAVMITNTDGALITASLRAGNVVVSTMAAGIALDGDFDNGIICHEYTHGISNRLTGGPANTSCLSNGEQGGEGWSDYVALMMTDNWATAKLSDVTKPRSIGTYATGEPLSGTGIRNYPYSTDMSIDPWTYAMMSSSGGEVHTIGEIWCSALWDMTWNIIQQENKIEPNLYYSASNGGNAIALQLVLEGMKLQPCNPGFIDARNAILAADSILYNYRHKCAIWAAFARRGMGVSALQGSASSTTDQTAAFDVPGVIATKTTEPIITTGQFSQKLTVTCGCAVPSGNYVLTDTLNNQFQYISSTGGSASNNIVTFPVAFNNPLETKTFTLTLSPSFTACPIDSVIYDDRDAHTKGGFASSTLNGNQSWSVSTTQWYSPTHSWYAIDKDSLNQFALSSDAFSPKGLSTFSFWHYLNTEYGYDGGKVEMQVNNGNWIDAAPYFTKNGYNGVIESPSQPFPTTSAFTGAPFPTFTQSLIDLSSFADSSVKVRFKMRCDSFAGAQGWFVDDITVSNGCGAYQKIGLYDNTGKQVSSYGIPVYNKAMLLPLTLLKFTAVAQGTSALLNWQTASETGTQKFIIETSRDGTEFTTLATLSAKGGSNNNYSATDANPYNGWNYYRLKMIDNDGTFSYSPVQAVLFAGKGLIVVKPNPAVSSTTIYFDRSLVLSQILVTDMQGKIIRQIPAKNISGSYTLRTANLAAGTYLIKAIPQTGSPVTVKLVVTH